MAAEGNAVLDRLRYESLFIHETLVEILLDMFDVMAGLYPQGRQGLRVEDRLERLTRLAGEVNGQMEEEGQGSGNKEGATMVTRIGRAHAAVGAMRDVNVAAA